MDHLVFPSLGYSQENVVVSREVILAKDVPHGANTVQDSPADSEPRFRVGARGFFDILPQSRNFPGGKCRHCSPQPQDRAETLGFVPEEGSTEGTDKKHLSGQARLADNSSLEPLCSSDDALWC